MTMVLRNRRKLQETNKNEHKVIKQEQKEGLPRRSTRNKPKQEPITYRVCVHFVYI